MAAQMKVIGFIGTGVMGKSMARNLLRAGYELYIYNRTKAKAEDLLNEGASWGDTPADVARKADAVITMVGYPKDVEETYFGADGLFGAARPGTILADMTTSSPSLARRIAEAARELGCAALDAPVSGGDSGAREAKLSIMVGGDDEAVERMMPVFRAMGSNIIHQGPAGAGQHTKLCNQIAIASNMMGVCEAIAYAEKAGLDPFTVLKSISTGAAGSFTLSTLAPRMLNGDFAPGFYIKHFIKDMTIALQSAEEIGLETYGLRQAKALYERLAAAGEENSGTQALFKLYRQ